MIGTSKSSNVTRRVGVEVYLRLNHAAGVLSVSSKMSSVLQEPMGCYGHMLHVFEGSIYQLPLLGMN